uniref:Uncharacterized protein n=1 Tax=Arundo donax TaxID=35708 RepID=A0A0A9C247_ARUDO
MWVDLLGGAYICWYFTDLTPTG